MSNNNARQTGLGTVGIVAAMVVVAVLAGFSFMAFKKLDSTKVASIPSTSPIAREEVGQPSMQLEKSVDPYEGMKRYNNEKYGVSFRYPADWTVEEVANNNPNGLVPVLFGINLKTDSTEKYAEAAVLEVIAKDYPTIVDFQEKTKRQSASTEVIKTSETKSRKQGAQLKTNVAKKDRSELYIFPVGSNTYSFSSINEELNAQRDVEYWKKFTNVYKSLELR